MRLFSGRLAVVVLFSLGLAQCGRPAEAPLAQASAAASAPAPGYDVQLTLSDGALKKLQDTKEKITFSAWYYGLPVKGAEKKADEVGQINLGGKQIELEPLAIQTFRVPLNTPDATALADVGNTQYVNINVFSARKTHEDNLLECELFEDKLDKAVAEAVKIHCELIYP